jgi:hypothetical protein
MKETGSHAVISTEGRNLGTADNYEISHLRFEMTEQALFLRIVARNLLNISDMLAE